MRRRWPDGHADDVPWRRREIASGMIPASTGIRNERIEADSHPRRRCRGGHRRGGGRDGRVRPVGGRRRPAPSRLLDHGGPTVPTESRRSRCRPATSASGCEFQADEPKPGTGGNVTLWVNDRRSDEGRMDHTVAMRFSFYAGMDVGCDNGMTVDPAYRDKAPYQVHRHGEESRLRPQAGVPRGREEAAQRPLTTAPWRREWPADGRPDRPRLSVDASDETNVDRPGCRS